MLGVVGTRYNGHFSYASSRNMGDALLFYVDR